MSQRATVLVVDDDEDTVDTMREILAGEGHVVLSARDGREALQVARDSSPDLVLLDLNMPGMDGRAFLAEMRAEPQLASLNVVVLSAAVDTHDVPCEVVSKPLRLDTLLGLIRKVAHCGH